MASIRDQSSGAFGDDAVFQFMTPGWRRRLREASFKGAAFHVEQQGRISGRRTVVFEYPKRDDPYAEDLGRHAVRYQITGYVIQKTQVNNDTGFILSARDVVAPRVNVDRTLPQIQRGQRSNFASKEYDICRDNVIQALESWGPGVLVDPYNNRIDESSGRTLFQCERYTLVETRERGGYAQFDMAFVEAGLAAYQRVPIDTTNTVIVSANASRNAAAAQLDRQQEAASAEE